MGLTPASRYNFIVSDESCCLSSLLLPLYLSCSAFIFGCSSCIFMVWRVWRTCSGIINNRISTVKTMMLKPKLSNRTSYNSVRLLIIGRMKTSFQRMPRKSKRPLRSRSVYVRKGRVGSSARPAFPRLQAAPFGQVTGGERL